MLHDLCNALSAMYADLQKSGWEAQVLGMIWSMITLVSGYSLKRVYQRLTSISPPSDTCAELLAKMSSCLPVVCHESEEGKKDITSLVWDWGWVDLLADTGKLDSACATGPVEEPILDLTQDLSKPDVAHVEAKAKALLAAVALEKKSNRLAALKRGPSSQRWNGLNRLLANAVEPPGEDAPSHCTGCETTCPPGCDCRCDLTECARAIVATSDNNLVGQVDTTNLKMGNSAKQLKRQPMIPAINKTK